MGPIRFRIAVLGTSGKVYQEDGVNLPDFETREAAQAKLDEIEDKDEYQILEVRG